MHGRSILPLLENKAFEIARTLHWEDQYNFAVLHGDWKLVRRHFDEKPSLYNIRQDMPERSDLSAQHPDRVSELLRYHDEWRRKIYPERIPPVTKRSYYIFPDK